MPVFDVDGIMKPAIVLIVEEAMSAAEDMTVVLVVRSEDEAAFVDVFHGEVDHATFLKLPKKQQDYGRRLMQMGQYK